MDLVFEIVAGDPDLIAQIEEMLAAKKDGPGGE